MYRHLAKRGDPVCRRQRKQNQREQSQHEQVWPSRRNRLAAEFQDDNPRWLRSLLAPQFAIGTPYNPPGYTASTTYIASNDGNATAANNLTNPSPAGLARPTGNSLGDLSGIGQSLSIIDPNSRSPRVQQFSLDVQRQLPFGIAAEIAYVGSRSSHLTQATANININALNPSLLSQGSALTQTVANPFSITAARV